MKFLYLICIVFVMSVTSKRIPRSESRYDGQSNEHQRRTVPDVMRQIECVLAKLKQIGTGGGLKTYQTIIQRQPTLQRQLHEACSIGVLQNISYVQTACNLINVTQTATVAKNTRNADRYALKAIQRGLEDMMEIDSYLKQGMNETEIRAAVYNNDPNGENLLHTLADAIDTCMVAKPLIKACEFLTGDTVVGTTIYAPDHPERGNVAYGNYTQSNCIF